MINNLKRGAKRIPQTITARQSGEASAGSRAGAIRTCLFTASITGAIKAAQDIAAIKIDGAYGWRTLVYGCTVCAVAQDVRQEKE